MTAEEDDCTTEATSVSIGSRVGIGDGFGVMRSFVWSDIVGALEALVEGCASTREPRTTNALVDKRNAVVIICTFVLPSPDWTAMEMTRAWAKGRESSSA